MKKGIYELGAMGYHFGDAITLVDMFEGAPEDALVMGNVSPSAQFRNGTPETMREETLKVLEACASYKNFVLSSGCDIPPQSSWENVDAFYAAAKEFYGK